MFRLYNQIQNFFDNIKNYIVTFTFTLIALIIILNFNNFGVAQDEYFSRSFGFINLNYIGNIFSPELTEKLKLNKVIPELHDYIFSYYSGAFFDSTAAALEIIFNFEDKKNQFLLRHFLISLFFFFSLVYFYRLILRIFRNWKIAIIGVLIIFLTPRIFADSFYNNKDILFMSCNIFSVFYYSQELILTH